MNELTKSLNGNWQLSFRPETATADAPYQTISAEVPGNVEIELMAAGLLPDVFQGSHALKTREFEFYEWVYETSFEVPSDFKGRRLELVFDGVDCIAVYTLNGSEIGKSENMFIEHKFNVSALANYGGANRLTVKISSAINHARKQSIEPSVQASVMESAVLRKAAHSFGWDIMPRLVSAGLWRSVALVAHEATEFTDLHFFTLRAGADAEIGLRYSFTSDSTMLEGFEILVQGACGRSIFEKRADVSFTTGEFNITVPKARLWWPRGYGEANLYDLTVTLLDHGKPVAVRKQKMGIRTAELIRTEITTKDKPGEFLFKINGEPVMCKGSNWVPLDALHSRDAGRVDAALELFRDLECNIIRCWGGNVYEDHPFFDKCDAYGIMVWQDFAMGCARYPQSPEFQQTLRIEAASVIRKLRNHASLVLWAGDNENDCMFVGYPDPGQNVLTRKVLPAAVQEFDFRRPYLPSSPYYSPAVVQQDRMDESLCPEQHLWGPRDYYKSKFYAESTAHFASEIGYHGCPNVASIRKFIAPDFLWPYKNNEQWRIHASDCTPKPGRYAYRIQLMADQIQTLFGFEPDNLEDFALASQISQAEAKKFFIEMFRLAKWRRTGIIWWNVLDGWPQFSDAVVDYYFEKKLAYHFIKRVQQPVCIMIGEPENGHCRVAVGNDTLKPASGTFKIWDADTAETLLGGNFSAPANRTQTIGKLRVSPGEQRLFLMEWDLDGKKYGNHYLLGTPPFAFGKYREWLKIISELPMGFNPTTN